MQSTGNPIETALRIIDNFCKEEYWTSIWEGPVDLGEIGILYTTFGDNDEHTLQVNVDLRKHEIRYEVDCELVLVDRYECVSDMCDDLDNMTYQSLYEDGMGAYSRRHPCIEVDSDNFGAWIVDDFRDWLREAGPCYHQGVF